MTMERDSLVARLRYYVGNPSAWDNFDDEASELMREAAAALSRPEQVVKALEWEEIHQRRSDEDPTTEWNGGYEADSALGYYEISMGFGSDAYYWTVSDPLSKDIGSDFEDPSDAKAAAQADYEQRILSALHPAPEAASAGAAAEALADHKWLDPECGVNGCQSLVWKGRYEAAVKGRADFRQAYREARAPSDTAPSQKGVSDGVRVAAQALIVARSSTFTARNGRKVGIQDDSGEKCWIVPFDEMAALETALFQEHAPGSKESQ